MLTVFFETYGCQMNVADSDRLAEMLAHEGYGRASGPSSADLVVINTCSVRENAERRARGRIAELAGVKRKQNPGQQLWVVGCMAERLGPRLAEEIPGVDRVIGTTEMETLGERIGEYLRHAEGTLSSRTVESGICSFVPVMRGCNNFCAYCIVPYVRGRERSVPVPDVEDEVKRAVDRGTKEVTLLGQNVNSYRDPASGADFPALLRRLHSIEGLLRIRFTTSHPRDCTEELIRTMAELPKLCEHMHLPVQAGSTRVLASMNRGYSREDYLRIVDTLRARMPDIDLTTDVMCGFPGEAANDFGETLALFREVRFTSAFMFAFSPREGTAAATLADQVPHAEAQRRLRELIELQTTITKERYASMVGRSVRVLFTERQQGRERAWMGQDYGCKRVLLTCDSELSGTIFDVRVRASTGMTLVGERETACGS